MILHFYDEKIIENGKFTPTVKATGLGFLIFEEDGMWIKVFQ